jgi:hypothetical protein
VSVTGVILLSAVNNIASLGNDVQDDSVTTSAPSDHSVSTLTDVPATHRVSMQRWLVEQRLGTSLKEWVTARQGEGKSWRAIADEMSATLGLPEHVTPVRHQTLQKWMRER